MSQPPARWAAGSAVCMAYIDDHGHPVDLGQSLKEGGEGAIYRVPSRPGLVAKLYARPPDAQREEKLAWMRDHPPQSGAGPHACFTWPQALIYDGRGCVGYLMPEVVGAQTLQVVANPRLRSRVWPSFDLKRQHRVARSLVRAADLAHGQDYVIGDVNQLNALASTVGLVTLIDTDSFQVKARVNAQPVTYRCTVGVAEYQPPEMLTLQGYDQVDREPEQDYWGLAVLVFQVLMDGAHPFMSRWLAPGEQPPLEEKVVKGYFAFGPRPVGPVQPPQGPRFDDLHPQLQDLVVRCFIDGHRAPDKRPSAATWEATLRVAEDALVLCPRGHYYQRHLPTCLTCAHPRPLAPIRPQRRQPHPVFPGLPGIPGLPPLPQPVPVGPAVPPLWPAPAPGAGGWVAPRAAHRGLWRWTARALIASAFVNLMVLGIALTPPALVRAEPKVNPLPPAARLLRVAEERAATLEQRLAPLALPQARR